MCIWPNVHFPENLFSGIATCQKVHWPIGNFPENLFSRFDTYQNAYLAKCALKTYFPGLTLSRMYIWPKSHLSENLFFIQKIILCSEYLFL